MSIQKKFWADTYAKEYITKNSNFDDALAVDCWKKMLEKTEKIESLLECGCNIGRNIKSLSTVLPGARKSIIELSKPAFDIVSARYSLDFAFNGSILESNIDEKFDLVYTMGVLIHIHPNDLIENMRKVYEYSKRYVILGEYFNRTPVSIEYQGRMDVLFKMDFGKAFIENFDVHLVDYGFLWGHLYDRAGFDDMTYWVFEKVPAH